MIEIPKASIISGQAGYKHYKLVNENFFSLMAIDHFENSPEGSNDKILGKAALKFLGYDADNTWDLFLVNYYTDFDTNSNIKRGKDFIYEMFDIFNFYDPGNIDK